MVELFFPPLRVLYMSIFQSDKCEISTVRQNYRGDEHKKVYYELKITRKFNVALV